MTDEEILAELEARFAEMMVESEARTKEMAALFARIQELRGRVGDPEPGDYRPRPSTPLRHPGDEDTEDSSSL